MATSINPATRADHGNAEGALLEGFPFASRPAETKSLVDRLSAESPSQRRTAFLLRAFSWVNDAGAHPDRATMLSDLAIFGTPAVIAPSPNPLSSYTNLLSVVIRIAADMIVRNYDEADRLLDAVTGRDMMSKGERYLAGIAHRIGYLAAFANRSFTRAESAIRRSIELFGTEDAWASERASALCALGSFLRTRGRNAEALAILEQASEVAAKSARRYLCHVLAMRGSLIAESGHPDQADPLFADAAEIAGENRICGFFLEWDLLTSLEIDFARDAMYNERFDDCQRHLCRATIAANEASGVPFLAALVRRNKIQYWIVSGQNDQISLWLRSRPNPRTTIHDSERLLSARAYLVIGRPSEAAQIIDEARIDASRLPCFGDYISLYILKAIAEFELGNAERAGFHIEHALRMAFPERRVQLFCDEGPGLEPLLTQTLAHYESIDDGGMDPTFLSFIRFTLDHCLATWKGYLHYRKPWILASPLTKTELEVLRSIANGNDTKAVSSDLDMSAQTVYTHTKNIFRKLDVHTRGEAVEKGIIEQII